MTDVVKEGQTVRVKITGIDERGKDQFDDDWL